MGETVGLVVGCVLTLAVFCYLFDLKPLQALYRLALHLFVGALVGYSLGVVVVEVLVKIAFGRLASDYTWLVPLVLGLWLLFFKSIPRLSYVGNFSIAFLVGVGVAVALGGALVGTLIPQIGATARAVGPGFNLGQGVVIVLGTVLTLLTFSFTFDVQSGRLATLIGRALLRAWLIVALGLAFAGALTASLSIFIGRIQYLIDAISRIAGFSGS